MSIITMNLHTRSSKFIICNHGLSGSMMMSLKLYMHVCGLMRQVKVTLYALLSMRNLIFCSIYTQDNHLQIKENDGNFGI